MQDGERQLNYPLDPISEEIIRKLIRQEIALQNLDASYLNKANAAVFTPDADYEPATKKYADDLLGGIAGSYVPLNYSGTAGEDGIAVNDAVNCASDGNIYKCDSDFNSTRTWNFIGFAKNAADTGEGVLVQLKGLVSGFSGLNVGNTYYLSGTPGAITDTPGTYRLKVGIAFATNQIYIDVSDSLFSHTINAQSQKIGSFTLSTDTDLTIGFVPRQIIFTFSNGVHFGQGYAYNNGGGTQACLSHLDGAGAGLSYNAGYVIYIDDGAGHITRGNVSAWGSTTTITRWTSGGITDPAVAYFAVQ